MADHVEQIESKLAAYVDGILTPEERAEIEQHLAANPSHLALISDLIAQKDMLARLPRERSPIDLSEDLQNHLERESLLGGPPIEEAGAAFRLNRWPQLLSMAAIVLLAFGVGMVVYKVLPPKYPDLALVQDTNDSKAPSPDDSKAEKAKVSDGSSAVAMASFGAPGKPTGAEVMPAAEGQMVVITVTADDLNRVNRDLETYLSANNYAWVAPSEAFIAQLDLNQIVQIQTAEPERIVAAASPLNDRDQRAYLKLAASTDRPDGTNGIEEKAALSELSAEVRAPVLSKATNPQLTEVLRRDAFKDDSPTQVQAQLPLAPGGAVAVNAQSFDLTQNPEEPPRPASRTRSRPPVVRPTDRVILVRNVNDQQVTALAQSLSQPERNQWAFVRRPAAETPPAAPAPDASLFYSDYPVTGLDLAQAASGSRVASYEFKEAIDDLASLVRQKDESTTRGILSRRLMQGSAIATQGLAKETFNLASSPLALAPASISAAESRAFQCMIVLQSPPAPPAPATRPAPGAR